MVQFAPFAAWRYDLSQVGELSAVTAPAPYLIDEVARERLYERHPCNAVRLVLNRAEPGDLTSHDRHARADDLLRLWQCEGVLIRDHDEAIYCSVTAKKSDWQNDENRGNCMAQGGASCGSYTSFD